MHRTAPILLGLCLFAAASAASGAGDDEHAHDHDARDAGGFPFGAPGEAARVSRTIEVIARDIAFDRSTIHVRPGETVRFVIRNAGQLLHEFNLGTRPMHEQHQDAMREMMQEGDLGATRVTSDAHHDHPNSVLLEPGETRELIWRFEHVHDVQAACNVPGHYQAGMHAEIAFTH